MLICFLDLQVSTWPHFCRNYWTWTFGLKVSLTSKKWSVFRESLALAHSGEYALSYICCFDASRYRQPTTCLRVVGKALTKVCRQWREDSPLTRVRAQRQANAERSMSMEWRTRENSWMPSSQSPKLCLHWFRWRTVPLQNTIRSESGWILKQKNQL